MTCNFVVWHRANKDGKFPLVVRVSNGSKMRKNIYTDLVVNAKHFNKKTFRCKITHPAYISINNAIKEIEERIEDSRGRFEAGNFSFNQVIGHIKGELNMSTLDEFVDTYFKKFKSDQSYSDYKDLLSIIKGHMNIKGNLKWKDITRDFLDNWQLAMQKRDLSNESIKSYAIKLQAILNDAEDREIISSYAKFPKALKQGGRKKLQNPDDVAIPTCTSKELAEMIDNVKSLEQWQTMALFTLSFGLRGFYPADIVNMKEANFNKPTLAKLLKDELYVYHLRSRTRHTKNVHMYIHINEDNQQLIMMLKRTTAKLWGKRYMEFLAPQNDSLGIWNYNPTENAKWHSNRWALHSRRLRKHGLNMKSPRKTFQTFCEEIEIADKNTPVEFNERTRLILLGRMGDPILEKSYSNKKAVAIRKAINEAHKYVLDKFNYKSLIYALQMKLESLNVPKWVSHQPLIVWNNMYEDMNTKGKGKELVNNSMYQVFGAGKITQKGLFVGFPGQWFNAKAKGSQLTAELVSKEYESYWNKFNDNDAWEKGEGYNEAIQAHIRKDKNIYSVNNKGKVIQLNISPKRKRTMSAT